MQQVNQNLKSVICVPEFWCPNWYTSLSNGLDTSLLQDVNYHFLRCSFINVQQILNGTLIISAI